MQETSTKPYMIRALHEWCTDNGYTPYLLVKVDANTVVPPAYIQDGQITLNIGHLATNALSMGNDYIEFQSRFNGQVEQLFIPVAAVSAIFAKETGAGMGFETQASDPYTDSADPKPDTTSTAPEKPAAPSHLKIVK